MNKLNQSKTQLLEYARSGHKTIPYMCNSTREIRQDNGELYKIPNKNIVFIKYIDGDVISITHNDHTITPYQTQTFLHTWIRKYLKPENLLWVRSN